MKTPNYPLYKDARDKAPHEYPPSGNTGLWFTRFFNQYDEYKDDKGKSKSQKLEWLQDIAKNAIGDGKKIKDLNNRQRELCKSLGGTFVEVETQSNFVTGMGLSHPVENGFTFHPTLGVPYLPASSVKGLLRGWVEAWMDENEDGIDNSAEYQKWFGTTECSGELIFFDALPSEPVKLACDVMTPHMGKWYEEKGDENNPPADWYSPMPVPFLVVQPKTKFHFMIAPRITGADVSKAMQELKNALEWIGAGAKTVAGYGRMLDTTPPPPPPAQTESWASVKVLFKKNTSEITAISSDGKTTSPLKGNDANNFRSALGEENSDKLKKKGELKNISVLVEKLGNGWKLLKPLS